LINFDAFNEMFGNAVAQQEEDRIMKHNLRYKKDHPMPDPDQLFIERIIKLEKRMRSSASPDMEI